MDFFVFFLQYLFLEATVRYLENTFWETPETPPAFDLIWFFSQPLALNFSCNCFKKKMQITKFISWSVIMPILFWIPVCNFQTPPRVLHHYAATLIDSHWCCRSIYTMPFHFAGCLGWCMLAPFNWDVQPLPTVPSWHLTGVPMKRRICISNTSRAILPGIHFFSCSAVIFSVVCLSVFFLAS